MPDGITVLVGVASLVLGWGLKTVTDAWTWRRGQVLDAYVEFLGAIDKYSLQVGQVWTQGTPLTIRDDKWVTRAQKAQEGLLGVDRAHGKLSLVARPRGAAKAFDAYIACEIVFRRAVANPPKTTEQFQSALRAMNSAYQGVVEQGRTEMGLRHWRERLPGNKPRWDTYVRRIAELNETDPYPDAFS